MSDSSKIHDEKYQAAKAAGLPGWGGEERIANLPQMLRDRFFAFEGTPKLGRLLELGCGAGNLSIELASQGFEVFGVDFSTTAITWAKENSNSMKRKVNFHVADITDLSLFSDENFDVVYDGNCLHCLIGERRKKALAESRRILKPEGILFISSLCALDHDSLFPSHFDPVSRILFESGKPYRFIPTPEVIQTEISDAGFKLLKTQIRSESPFGHINIHAMRA